MRAVFIIDVYISTYFRVKIDPHKNRQNGTFDDKKKTHLNLHALCPLRRAIKNFKSA